MALDSLIYSLCVVHMSVHFVSYSGAAGCSHIVMCATIPCSACVLAQAQNVLHSTSLYSGGPSLAGSTLRHTL